jgi:hypothetical protein
MAVETFVCSSAVFYLLMNPEHLSVRVSLVMITEHTRRYLSMFALLSLRNSLHKDQNVCFPS